MSQPSFDERPNSQFAHYVVNAPVRTMLDLRRNSRFALAALGCLVAYCVVSAFAMDVLETRGLLDFTDPIEKCDSCLKGGSYFRYFDALYFTWMNVTSVGFGDIAPHTPVAKGLACLNAIVGLVLIGCIVAIVTASLTPSAASSSGKAKTKHDQPSAPLRGWKKVAHWFVAPWRWFKRRMHALGRWIEDGQRDTTDGASFSTEAEGQDDQVSGLVRQVKRLEDALAQTTDALGRERTLVDTLVRSRLQEVESGDRHFHPDSYKGRLDHAYVGRRMELLVRRFFRGKFDVRTFVGSTPGHYHVVLIDRSLLRYE